MSKKLVIDPMYKPWSRSLFKYPIYFFVNDGTFFSCLYNMDIRN